MSDETFRQRIFIQYNVRSIDIDLNMFDDELKDGFNHVKDVHDIFNKLNLSKDNLLGDEAISTVMDSVLLNGKTLRETLDEPEEEEGNVVDENGYMSEDDEDDDINDDYE